MKFTQHKFTEAFHALYLQMPVGLQLPPDPDGQNDDRALWAINALAAFCAVTGTEPEDAVADLLCDLRHYCDRCNLDFAAEDSRGRYHYVCEVHASPVSPEPNP